MALFLFRDPTVGKGRHIAHVLDLKQRSGGEARSRLFRIMYQYLFAHFPEGVPFYLDNFIRRRASQPLAELNRNYFVYMETPARLCFEATQKFVRRHRSIGCVVFADERTMKWLYNRGYFVETPPEVSGYLGGLEGNSTVCLGKRLAISGWEAPVYFFPHPQTLGNQGELYRKGGKYADALDSARTAILRAVE